MARNDTLVKAAKPRKSGRKLDVDDIRAVLQDAIESAKDEHNVAALERILEHLGSAPLAFLGRS